MAQPQNPATGQAAKASAPATFAAREVIDPALVTFADELREMVNYFTDERKRAGKNDGELERLNEIEKHLNETADLLGELVAIQFLKSTYFAE